MPRPRINEPPRHCGDRLTQRKGPVNCVIAGTFIRVFICLILVVQSVFTQTAMRLAYRTFGRSISRPKWLMASTPWNSRLVERVEATVRLFLQILQIVVTLTVSPLSAGIPARFEAITPVITNELLSVVFLADLVGGALLLIVASMVISSSVLDTAGPLVGLRESRVVGSPGLFDRA